MSQRGGPWFVVPALGLLGFSVVLPFLVALGLTFTDQRLLSPNETEAVGLDNYARLLSVDVLTVDEGVRLRDVLRADPAYAGYRPLTELATGGRRVVVVAQDPVFYRSLFNTFVFVVLVIPLQCGTALGLALLVNQRLPGRTAFRTAFFSPVVTSMVVVSIVWAFLYNENSGLLNRAFAALSGGRFEPVDWLGSEALAMPAIVVMSAWQGAGFQMLIFLAGLQSIDPRLYEAAALDGANAWQRFRYVTLPGLRNTTLFVVISTTLAAFALFTQVDVMTGGGPNDATSTLIFHAVRSGFRQQDVAYGATIAVVFFVLVLGIALVQRSIGARADA
ncbi:MAG: sugar ABC transporter permease [Myxococcota bacterium]